MKYAPLDPDDTYENPRSSHRRTEERDVFEDFLNHISENWPVYLLGGLAVIVLAVFL